MRTHRIVERPHPIIKVHNPKDNELHLSDQQKRFDTYLRGEMVK